MNMKKFAAILLSIMMMFTLSARAEENETTGTEAAPEGSKILVAYFSATNNTEGVAQKLAEGLGADLYEIMPEVPYTDADLNYGNSKSRSSVEMDDPSARPAISGAVEHMEQYDIVFIGYPIWWGEAPRIMSTFIESYDFSGKTIVAFCTSASSGFGRSDAALREAAPDAVWLEGHRFAASVSADDVMAWANGLALNLLGKTASTVYFTSDISAEGMLTVFEALGWTPTGNVAVKLSTGEPPASNYLRPELIKDVVQSVNGTIVECNTAYGGSRSETAMHMQVAKDHGFTDIANVDILDAEGSMELPVTGGTYLQTNLAGGHFGNYDSYVVLSHFKGHAMAGFGGAIKNISIGLGSQEGKCLIHTGGRSHTSPWGGDQTAFTESMAEAAKSVYDYLGNGERIVFINVLNRISIDCDCDGNPAEPDIHDIGILASLDPVAIDQAAIDLCFAAEGSESLQQRVERQNGLHTLEHAEEIGLGSRTYTLENIDE